MKYQVSLCSPCSPSRSSAASTSALARARRFGANSRRNSIHAPIRKATQTIADGASAARSCVMRVTSTVAGRGSRRAPRGRANTAGALPAPGTLPCGEGRNGRWRPARRTLNADLGSSPFDRETCFPAANSRRHSRSSIRVLPKVLGFTRSRSRNSATPSSYERSNSA